MIETWNADQSCLQHCLSLPIFLFFTGDLKRGFQGLAHPASIDPFSKDSLGIFAPYIPHVVLGANMLTQLACVSGVNQLSSVRPVPPSRALRSLLTPSLQRISSVSTNLVLTTRKALSLCFSVWWFGNGWNAQLGVGAGMVFLGSVLYTAVTSRAGSAPRQLGGGVGPGKKAGRARVKAE